MNFKDLLQEIKASIRELSVDDVRQILAEDKPPILIDVRQRSEAAEGMIEDALSIPRGLLDLALGVQVPDREQPIVFYCAGGTRSALAAEVAAELGYKDTASMGGGFGRWKQAGASFYIPSLPEPASDPEEGVVASMQYPAISINELIEDLASDNPPILIDLREDDETETGFIPNAHLQPRGFLEMRIESLVPNKDTRAVLISSQGIRAAAGLHILKRMGYTNLFCLKGGFNAWKDAGEEVKVPKRLSYLDRLRYSRHLLIPEVGEEGQLKLLESRVLLMGAGGLGSPAAYYLAAAGVGVLGIIDSDVVDRSNLQRQILHTDDRVGLSKVDSARQTLAGLNPDIEIITYDTRLTSDNVLEIFNGYDVVVDGGDNFPTRYLVNDACVHMGIACVHGSVYRFEGQATVFSPNDDGPCYRCLYPEPPPPELAPSCAEAGVLGVVPGIIGLIQANETIKLLLGSGRPLIGRLLHFDALSTRFKELRLRQDPQCTVCGKDAQWNGFVDYQYFCGLG